MNAGESKFRYKIKKTLPVTVNGFSGSNIKLEINPVTLKGKLLPGPDSDNYWYVYSPVAGSMNVDVNILTDDIGGRKDKIIKTLVPPEDIVQLGVEGSDIGVSSVLDKIEITETYSKIQETATITLKNPIFAGTHNGSLGGLRIWSDGTDTNKTAQIVQ